MPRRRFRIEFWDEDGAKHTLSVSGHLSREKVARILDYVELMGASKRGPQLSNPLSIRRKFDRVWDVVATQFQGKLWFGAGEVKAMYEQVFAEKIPLSTVATYLSRLSDRGLLDRVGQPGERRYGMRVMPGSEPDRSGSAAH